MLSCLGVEACAIQIADQGLAVQLLGYPRRPGYVTQFLLFLPLGALLAVWPLRTRGRWQHLLPVLYLSVVCEIGKIVVAERFLDVTHILIQMAGAAIGWIVVRRSGFPVYGEVWSGRTAQR